MLVPTVLIERLRIWDSFNLGFLFKYYRKGRNLHFVNIY